MPSWTSASSRIARLNVKPAPSTLSESFAILSKLKTFGAIYTFVKKQDAHSPRATGVAQDQGDASDTYTVVYKSIYPQFQNFCETRKHPVVFDVQTNGNHPIPFDIDPYNVRGLLDRKPHPQPRTFFCTLTIAAKNSEEERQEETILKETNGLSEPFAVDRGSVFGKVLARSNAPPNLILGLLPKVKAEGRQDDIEIGATGSVEQSQQGNRRYGRGRPSRDLAKFSLADLYRETNK